MSLIIAALIPIAGVIALGWTLRRTGLVGPALWPSINRLSYQALLPALLFSTISTAQFDGGQAGLFLLSVTASFLVMGVIVFAFKPLPIDGPAFTSLFQGGVRWNGFVLLALAAGIFGAEGAALVSLAFAPTVPLINIMCVAVLSIWGASEASPDFKRVSLRILTNPLILACAAGALANQAQWFQSGPVADTAALAGRAALPLILLAIGAGLDFSALKTRPGLLALSVTLKLVIAPAVFYAIALALGLEGLPLVLAVAMGAAPGAAAAYVLASEMGGDARLMAGHVTATTLLAFIALPVWIGIAGG